MDCPVCHYLDQELKRPERDHARKLGALAGSWIARDERQRARDAERDSRNELSAVGFMNPRREVSLGMVLKLASFIGFPWQAPLQDKYLALVRRKQHFRILNYG